MKVLMAIKPKFADKIFSGEKTFEYRRSIFKDKNVKSIVVYSTLPTGKVIGEFSIKKILYNSPANIWKNTKEFSGIDKKDFMKYFEGKEKGYAIEIKKTKLYKEPKKLNEIKEGLRAPQSFIYLKEHTI